MVKYLIIPRWLFNAMSYNSCQLTDLLNLNISSSLLSEVELSFYIASNLIDYSDFYINETIGSLFRKLNNADCQNCLTINNEFIDYIEGREKKLCDERDILTHLITNPIYTVNNNSLITDFEPLLIGKDILGLIPTHEKVLTERPYYSVRKDIYKVMNEFMSVEDIVHNSLFGV